MKNPYPKNTIEWLLYEIFGNHEKEEEMDPNEALKQLREELQFENLGEFPNEHIVDIRRVVELFQGLDDWLSRGGFLPTEWERK